MNRAPKKKESDNFVSQVLIEKRDGKLNLGKPLKKADGEPLLRKDISHDLLAYLFSLTEFQFTPPSYADASAPLFPSDRLWSFAELYLDCIANSQKAPKTLKERFAESQEYAVNYGKMCLLVNLNRINTTHAFWPECRTLNRTFHCVPAFQTDEFTRKNFQDAPRLKAQLKGCALPHEISGNVPDNLKAIAAVLANGVKPATTVVNVIFALVNEANFVTAKYLPPPYTLTDLVVNQEISSFHRAYGLLYLIHRFLEDPAATNDFTASQRVLGFGLINSDTTQEDVDSLEEVEFGNKVRITRAEFVAKLQEERKAPEQTSRQLAPAREDSMDLDARSSVKEATPLPNGRPTLTATQSMQSETNNAVVLAPHSNDQRHIKSTWLPHDQEQSNLRTTYQRMQAAEDALYDSDEDNQNLQTAQLRQRIDMFKFASENGPMQVVYSGRKQPIVDGVKPLFSS